MVGVGEVELQHVAEPSCRRAQTWLPPAAIAVTPVRGSLLPSATLTVNGAFSGSPCELRPGQHVTELSTRRAQPAVIAVTSPWIPTTSTGVRLLVVVPVPSEPKSLAPQHFTLRETIRAQLTKPPVSCVNPPWTATAVTPDSGLPLPGAASTGTGAASCGGPAPRSEIALM